MHALLHLYIVIYCVCNQFVTLRPSTTSFGLNHQRADMCEQGFSYVFVAWTFLIEICPGGPSQLVVLVSLRIPIDKFHLTEVLYFFPMLANLKRLARCVLGIEDWHALSANVYTNTPSSRLKENALLASSSHTDCLTFWTILWSEAVQKANC